MLGSEDGNSGLGFLVAGNRGVSVVPAVPVRPEEGEDASDVDQDERAEG